MLLSDSGGRRNDMHSFYVHVARHSLLEVARDQKGLTFNHQLFEWGPKLILEALHESMATRSCC